VTPSWNSAAFIEHTIKSVRGQTYPNIEYIIVDGGSSDGTMEIIHHNEPYIASWISEPDKGMYQAINKGIKMAKGDIIAYLNSDDIYYPDTVSKVVKYFSENQDVDLIYGNLDFIAKDGSLLFNQIYPKFSLRYFKNANYSMIGQPSAFWRAGLARKIGLFDEHLLMAADFDYFIRAGMASKIMHVNETLAAFRVHPESLTSSMREVNLNEINGLHKKYCNNPSIYGAKISRILYDIYFKFLNFKTISCRLFNALGGS
jgi:glycosyltransferase involved in cell wall biosynthesis